MIFAVRFFFFFFSGLLRGDHDLDGDIVSIP